jgi:hypothetical protein
MIRSARLAESPNAHEPIGREVLIPLVGAGSTGALARIAADGQSGDPHPAQLDRRLSPLLQSGLYPAGEQALAAVRLLNLPRGSALGNRLRAAAGDEALHVVNPGDIRGLGPENSSSAELGLALALLMFRAQTSETRVLASGALDLNGADHDTPVVPVHHLGDKLRLALQYFDQPGSPPAPRWFMVPALDPDGSTVQGKYRAQSDALRARGIELCCVRSLGEAARILGAHKYAPTRAEYLVRWAAAAVCVAAGVAALAHVWLNAPIPLSFAPVADTDHSLIATPVRVRARGASAELLAPCRLDDGRLPGFTIGDEIAMQLHAGSADGWSLGGYHLALVAVSASAGVKVLPVPPSQILKPGGDVGYQVDVPGPEEETLLVWLAKRGAAFDLAALQDRLRRAEAPLRPADNISAVRNVLQHAAPGILTYDFRSVGAGKCP